jgi:hypothetical protein
VASGSFTNVLVEVSSVSSVGLAPSTTAVAKRRTSSRIASWSGKPYSG